MHVWGGAPLVHDPRPPRQGPQPPRPKQPLVEKLIQKLNKEFARLKFSVPWVYNPWEYAQEAYLDYWRRYGATSEWWGSDVPPAGDWVRGGRVWAEDATPPPDDSAGASTEMDDAHGPERAPTSNCATAPRSMTSSSSSASPRQRAPS